MELNHIDTDTIWQEFGDHVRAFLRSKVATDQEAEDLLQEIFLRIHEGLDNLNHEERVQSWVFGITRRVLADYYRSKHRSREQRHPQPLDEASPARDSDHDNISSYPGDHDVHEEVLSWLIPMIDQLPEKYRVPLKMADVKGKTQQEVADHLGLSLSGAKSRVQRGRDKLGEVLAACCEVEFGNEGRAVSFRRRENDCGQCD